MAAALHRLRLLARLDELIVRLEVRLSERRMEPEDGAAAGADMARLRGRARLAERRLALLDGRRRAILAGLNGLPPPSPAADQRAARGPRRGRAASPRAPRP
jgi:hypothetical protein